MRTLIELGTPLEARNSYGLTPILGCDDPAIVRELVKGGADLEAREDYGATPLLYTSDDRVALILLDAGANPRVKDRHGTLRQHATKHSMPATLAWLDAHDLP